MRSRHSVGDCVWLILISYSNRRSRLLGQVETRSKRELKYPSLDSKLFYEISRFSIVVNVIAFVFCFWQTKGFSHVDAAMSNDTN